MAGSLEAPVRRVVVTVVGSRRRVNVALPAEPPIRELVGSLAERCGERAVAIANGDSQATWVLSTSDARELSSEQSLDDCRVEDGSVLYLQAARHGTPALTPADLAGPEKRQVLPRRMSRAGRGLEALIALLPGGGRLPRPVGDGANAGASAVQELMARRPVSPLMRARRAWSQTSYAAQLDAVIAAPRLSRCVTVAVMSPKGGVGKTVMAVLIGMLLASLRRDRVVAVDTNPDHGSLGRSLAPDHATFVDDLLYLFQTPSITATALDRALGRGPAGLMVLPAPTDPARMARLDEDAYVRVIRRLQELVGVVVLDCGTGLQDPGALAALRCADSVVLVTDAEPATASIVVEASQVLTRARRPILLVVNKMPPRGARLDVSALLPRVPAASGVIVVPWNTDAASRVGVGDFEWDEAPHTWRVAVRELVAVLFGTWRDAGLAV
ncbi:MAG TPA: EsaB/YukD family protein [Candidatus Dormibacteraeota bacterium]